MKAIAVTPLKKNSQRLIEVETPLIDNDSVLVKVLQTGVCRTDLEIIEGLYGLAPEGKEELILGHESIGRVADKGKNVPASLEVGNLVVRTVRRPCPDDTCLNCRNGHNDMCSKGGFTEIGIKGLDGIMCEQYTDSADYLIKIPSRHKDVGVLLEPLSFVEKIIDQTLKVQQRFLYWNLQSSLVIGSGPIGLLAAMVLRTMGVETTVMARSKHGNRKSELVKEMGARYLSISENNARDLAEKVRKVDLVIEASGNSKQVIEGMKYLGSNGVMALTSITGGYNHVQFNLDPINNNIVLNNNLILGIVNANIKDYQRGVGRFDQFENYWPGLAGKLITRKVPLDDYASALSKGSSDIKNVIDFNP